MNKEISKAFDLIAPNVLNTKIISSSFLNQKFGAEVFFKCENFQETGSFKARGAFNAILAYCQKHGEMPKKIAAVSSGNHARALAYASQKFGIEALIYMAQGASQVKIDATRALGAQVIVCKNRFEADEMSRQKALDGYYFIHPSGNQDVINGQATACFEALNEIPHIDAVFAPIGGGGLAAGSYLACQEISPKTLVFGCEPEIANDAAISLRDNKIFAFKESPKTVADGARTLKIMPICFEYLKKIAGILEISENEILRCQKQFFVEFNFKIEPTSALAVAGAWKFCQENDVSNKKLLVIISGGNV